MNDIINSTKVFKDETDNMIKEYKEILNELDNLNFDNFS